MTDTRRRVTFYLTHNELVRFNQLVVEWRERQDDPTHERTRGDLLRAWLRQDTLPPHRRTVPGG